MRQGYKNIKAHTCRIQPVDNSVPLKSAVDSIERSPAVPSKDTERKECSNDSDSESSCYSKNFNIEDDAHEDSSPPEIVPHREEDSAEITVSKLKRGQTVSFIPNDSAGEVHKAVILSNAGKKSGPFKNWYNIKYVSPENVHGSEISINLESVQDLTVNDVTTVNNASYEEPTEQALHVDNEDFSDAKDAELISWKRNNAYVIVQKSEIPHQHQKFLSGRWVLTMKKSGEGNMIPKARYVVRGFEEDTSNIVSDSPTCSKDSLRALITVACQKKWRINSIDIKTAFLQGEEITRDVYLKPPVEAKCKEGEVWKLKKCVYGLTDASLRWYDRVVEFMCSSKGRKSTLDPALFHWNVRGEVSGIIAVHVDDFIWCGNDAFESTVIGNLRNTFQVGKEEASSFQYLGLRLQQSLMGVALDQKQYIEGLREIEIPTCISKDIDMHLSDDLRDALRSKVGQLLWVANQTRPDISFDVSSTAVSMKCSTMKNILHINKIIRKVKNNHSSLQFFSLGKATKIIAYTDAAFANLADGGSQGGYLIFLANANGDCCLLSWESKRIRRIVRSALAAECLAMPECLDAAIYISLLYKELMYGNVNSKTPEIEIVTDSKSLCDAIKSVKNVTEKRLRVDIGAVKEALKNNEIHNVRWVNSSLQLSDCLTKHGANNDKLLQILKCNKLPI